MGEQKYTHTVHCFDDKTKRQHFTSHREAVAYANQLLRAGHKAQIYPYSLSKRYIDYLAERGPDG